MDSRTGLFRSFLFLFLPLHMVIRGEGDVIANPKNSYVGIGFSPYVKNGMLSANGSIIVPSPASYGSDEVKIMLQIIATRFASIDTYDFGITDNNYKLSWDKIPANWRIAESAAAINKENGRLTISMVQGLHPNLSALNPPLVANEREWIYASQKITAVNKIFPGTVWAAAFQDDLITTTATGFRLLQILKGLKVTAAKMGIKLIPRIKNCIDVIDGPNREILLEIAREVDIIMCSNLTKSEHVLKGPQEAARLLFEDMKNFSRAFRVENPSLEIILSDLAWPSQGESDLFPLYGNSMANLTTYWNEIIKFSNKNKVRSYLYEAFDEPWRRWQKGLTQPVGGHFGLWRRLSTDINSYIDKTTGKLVNIGKDGKINETTTTTDLPTPPVDTEGRYDPNVDITSTQLPPEIDKIRFPTRYPAEEGVSSGVTQDNKEEENGDGEGPSSLWIVLLVFFLLVLIIVVSFVTFKFYRQKVTRVTAVGLSHLLNLERRHSAKPKLENDYGDEREKLNVAPDGYLVPLPQYQEIQESHLIIEEDRVLGRGVFGIVYEGTYNGTTVAVKTLKLGAETKLVKTLEAELKVMRHLKRHPNVVYLIGSCTKDGKLHVVTEICSGGCLRNYLTTHQNEFRNNFDKSELPSTSKIMCPYSTRQLLNWGLQIATAMEYLECNDVIHSDLATRNVLLDEYLTPKVADFGLSRTLYQDGTYLRSTQEPLPWAWMAIESLENQEYSHKSDVWSFGITLWELYSLGAMPYAGMNWTTDFSSRLTKGLRLHQPELAPDHIFEIMTCCWSAEPGRRPKFSWLRNALLEAYAAREQSPAKS